MRAADSRTSLALCAAILLGVAALHSQGPAPQSIAQQFEEAVTLVDSRGDCAAAVPAFEHVASGKDRALAARALVYLGSCYERLGNEKARQAYRRVIEKFPDQRAAANQARARLAALERNRGGSVGLTLRPLWNRSGPWPMGHATVDGHTLPLGDDNGALVLSNLNLDRQGPPVPMGLASGGLAACKPDDNLDLVLSPDAHEAAFTCEASPDHYELRVVRTDGKFPHERRLLASAVELIEWREPDRLLVQRRATAEHDLAFVRADTGAVQSITPLTSAVNSATVSPDGKWVAFDAPDRTVPVRRDIMLVPTGGGPPVAITTGPWDNLFPAWTPNGQGILFISDRTGSSGLWVQGLAGGRPAGAPQLLTQDLGRVTDVWAATAGEFVYSRQIGLAKIAMATLKPDGTVTEPVIAATRQLGGTLMPGWSPDGTRLAYQTRLTGIRSVALGILDLRTGEERMLRALPHLGMPRWSADGRSVVVKGYDRDGHYGLFLIELSTGRVSPLKLVPRMDETELGPYRWAPDGSLLVMIGHTCQKIDVQTGESAVLWTIDGRPGRFSILARTGDIAYIHQVKGATTIEVRNSDGTTRELLRARPDENFDFVEWVPDGSALIFTRHTFARGSGKAPQWPSLWRLDVRTLMARPMGLSVDSLRDVTVSPDGTQIAFTTGSPTQELWILEHYLPASYTAPPRR